MKDKILKDELELMMEGVYLFKEGDEVVIVDNSCTALPIGMQGVVRGYDSKSIVLVEFVEYGSSFLQYLKEEEIKLC